MKAREMGCESVVGLELPPKLWRLEDGKWTVHYRQLEGQQLGMEDIA